jgi:hypothetical protein
MKKISIKLLSLLALSTMIVACSEEETPAPTGPTYKELVSFQANLLGGQTNPNLGSFYSVSEDSIYFTARANQKQSFIDLIYYFGSQTGDSSVITSPSDPVFNNVQDQNPHFSVKSWTVKNNTTFLVTDLTEADFIALANDSLLTANMSGTLTATKAAKLVEGDVVGFKMTNGRLGIFHVKDIENTNALTRAITIDVKVQKL